MFLAFLVLFVYNFKNILLVFVKGSTECVELLLGHKDIDVNMPQKNFKTPLNTAIEAAKNASIVSFIILGLHNQHVAFCVIKLVCLISTLL